MDSSSLTTNLLSFLPNPRPSLLIRSTRFSTHFSRPLFLHLQTLHGPNTSPSLSSCALAHETPFALSDPRSKLLRLAAEFRSLQEPIDRVKRLLHYASDLPPFNDDARTPENRVMGCTAQVWVSASMDASGRMRFAADSDSEITRGFCSCLIEILDGALPEEVLEMRPEDLGDLNVVGLPGRANSRVNTWHNVLIRMQKRTKALLAEADGRVTAEPFPSLAIGPDGIHAKGSYAEAQDEKQVS